MKRTGSARSQESPNNWVTGLDSSASHAFNRFSNGNLTYDLANWNTQFSYSSNSESEKVAGFLPPIGLIPRIVYTRKHLEFLNSYSNLSYVMINMDVAERLANRGISSFDILPKGRVITTSTIADPKLCRYTVEDEIELVKNFKPAWHIPCDYPVYYEESKEGRQWFIDAVVEDTKTFIRETKQLGIGTIPLIKGIDESEWRRSINPFRKMGVNNYAFYVKQYYGRNRGKNDNLMVEHVRRIVHSCDINYVMLIGYQSPNRIQDLPPEVRAFAGERWIRGSDLIHLSPEQARIQYLAWERHFKEKSNVRQTVLHLAEENVSMEGT